MVGFFSVLKEISVSFYENYSNSLPINYLINLAERGNGKNKNTFRFY